MGAAESKEARARIVTSSISGATFPTHFELRYDSLRGGFKLMLGEDKQRPTNVCSLPGGWHGDMILYNGPDNSCDPLAVVKSGGTLGQHDDIQIAAAQPGQALTEERMKHFTRGLHVGYAFSTPVGPDRQQERFEWRGSRGEEVKKLGEQSSGWKLVRLDYKEEVVAVWSEVKLKMTLTQAAVFEFVGSGATGDMGPEWTVLAVTTFLRIWQRRMQMYSSAGIAGGVSAGVAAAGA